MKTLLILTGPQGAGNHLWSKIFALHPQVFGWRELLSDYWIGHDREPFADCWTDPAAFKNRSWNYNYYVTSISVPYMNNGEATIPDFKKFVTAAQAQGFIVKLAVVGRDKNVIEHQQQRVRNGITLDSAINQYSGFANPVFLSYELLHLYREKYLESVSRQLEFPIDYKNTMLDTILATDTNKKYIKAAKAHGTDELAKKSSSKWK